MVGDEEKVIAYFAKALSKCQQKYCVTRKELLAVILAVKHFHTYLAGAEFTIRSDHSSLRWLTHFRDTEGQIARWLQFLGGYTFTIEYRPGKKHANADGLSRSRPCSNCPKCEKTERFAEAMREASSLELVECPTHGEGEGGLTEERCYAIVGLSQHSPD